MAIIRGLVNFCWFFFKWGLVVSLLGALVGVPYLYQRVDEEIRQRIEQMLAEHYTDLTVTVRSARLVEDEGGIEILGVTISEPGAAGPQAQLAYFDELFVTCDSSLTDLVQHEPKISRIVVRRPQIQCTRRPDGSWSSARLLPLPKFGERPPEIRVESGTIEIFDPLQNPSTTISYHDLQLAIAPAVAGTPQAIGTNPLQIQGTFTGEHLRQVDVEGTIADSGQRWLLAGRVDALELSQELFEALPADLREQFRILNSIRARAQLTFRLQRDPSREKPFLFALDGQVVQGRIDDPRLPYPLNELRGKWSCDERGFVIHDLQAKNGPTTVQLSAQKTGYGETSPWALSMHCRKMMLDRQLVSTAPDVWRNYWNDFLPAGVVDVDLKLNYDGQEYHPDVQVNCVDTSFTYHKFPYRLERAQGTLRWVGTSLQVSLTAQGGGEQVRIDGRFHELGPRPHGTLQIWGDNLRLDQQLVDALPERPREVVASLHPSGHFSVGARFWREPGETAEMQQQIQIRLNQGSIHYEKFPYPLTQVRGVIEAQNDHWTFRDLEGTNDGGRVTCHGSLMPAPNGSELVLNLRGTQVPIEDELRNALSPPMQRLWNDLNPRGTLDVETQVRYQAGGSGLDVWTRVIPLGGDTAIEPRWLPYRLDQVRGAITYHNGRVELDRMSAMHGPVKLETRGTGEFGADGGWHLDLRDLSIDRLTFDRDVRQALAEPFKELVYKHDPRGVFHVAGSMRLFGDENVPLRAQWTLRIDAHNAEVDCGLPLRNIYGSTTLVGGYDGQRLESRGELNVDSLMYKDMQWTQVRGPLYLDDSRVLLGMWSQPPKPGATPRHITAEAYGGKIYGDGWVTLGDDAEFGLQASLVNADLSRVGQEMLKGQKNMTGQADGSIRLRGRAEGVHTLRGEGDLRLRDAYVYDLPQMVALLKILSVKPPDTNAFTSSEVDFRVEADHIYFDRIDFYGDAISLKGTGEMGLDTKIGLNFYAMVGRDEMYVPVIGDLLRGASEQIMLIRVDGKLDDPNIRREPFPGVNQVLQQLQAELNGTGGRSEIYPDASGMPRAGQKPNYGQPAMMR